MKRVCSGMVPRLLTPEQKEIRMNICADILQNTENDPNFLDNLITCDESCFFFFKYDPKSKRQSIHLKSPSSQRQKKARQSKFKLKAMMIFPPSPTSEGLFTWIGCLKVRPLTRSTTRRFWQTFVNWWEEDLKCGSRAHGFFTKTTRRHTAPCLSRCFWRSTRSPCLNTNSTHLP